MDYEIKIEKLVLKNDMLTVSFSGTAQTNNSLVRPKWILYFVQNGTDRRIPLVTDTMFFRKGSWYFAGNYTYRLDCLFREDTAADGEIRVWLNGRIGDFYGEKLPVCLEPDEVICDRVFWSFQAQSNRWSLIPSGPCGHRTLKNPGKRVRIFRGFSFGLCICLSPWLLVQSVMAEKGLVPHAPGYDGSGGKKRRIAKDLNQRIFMLSGHKITSMGLKLWVLKRMYSFARHRKVRSGQVGFVSVRRKDLSGNMEYVYRQLEKREKVTLKTFLPGRDTARMSLKDLMRAAKICAISNVIVLDEYTSFIYYLKLKPETKIFQLWHACGAFKTFGYTRLGKSGGTPQDSPNHRNYDYVTVSSENVRECYAEGFGVPLSSVIATGVPRTDIFADEAYKEKICRELYEKYPVCKDRKVILFAPTFRGNIRKEAYYPMEKFDIGHFLEHIPEDYMVIIKHHPFVSSRHPIPERCRNRVLDLSGESELNDLLFIADLVITDYSSLVFEASLLDLPMLFYTFDLHEYIEKRDFYFSYESFVPGRMCSTLEELERAVSEKDFEQEKTAAFAEKYFDRRDGKASARVADLICSVIDGHNRVMEDK